MNGVIILTGFDEFAKIFGEISVLSVVELFLAGLFLYLIYKKVRDHLIKVHESEKKRDEQLREALEAVRKYPEYRKQSVQIQQKLENDIQALRRSQEETMERLVTMEELTKRTERNKLRDLLLQNYRFYTNSETNPNLSWTKMESEAFWELFRDYEDAGGNGYMHTDVLPAMEKLRVIDISNKII